MLPRRYGSFLCLALVACTQKPVASPPCPTEKAPLAAPASASAPIGDESDTPITFERMAKFPEPGWQVPRSLKLSPDQKTLTYLLSESPDRGDEMALWSMDLATGKSTVLVRAADLVTASAGAAPSRAEELRNERQRKRIKGITDYQWAKTSATMAIPAASSVFVRKPDGSIARVTPAGVEAIDPKLSADGSKLAYVRGSELELADVATGKTVPLTSNAPKGVTRGQSDFNAQEE
ncbi:MAG: DPP IV N-terminal domain-containing protein, partial [Myxococcales bacterium]|nr:DPP IV N-terminal domain-containing protein [Myxococcales bacterium]